MTSPLSPKKMQGAWVRRANIIGAPLKAVISFQPEFLMDRARKLCHLDDFGGDDFQEPFRILARSYDRHAHLHFTGRVVARRHLVRCLINRLKITEYWRRNPGTENVALPDPVVITGLPRTGSTFLHKTLAQDRRIRTLPLWEMSSPVPPGWGDASVPDTRLARWRRGMQSYWKVMLSPAGRDALKSIHGIEADDPAECWHLLQYSFRCGSFGWFAAGDEYNLWLYQQDLTDAYRYYRKLLQILTASAPAERLVVKYPGHLLCLDELIRVFPNARILWLHRDPVDVVPSICSLSMIARMQRTNGFTPVKLGQEWLEGLTWTFGKGMAARLRHRPEQFLDVYYHDLTRNPAGAVRRIYDFLGWQADPDWDDNLRSYLARDRESRQGLRHRYSPEDFGLTADMIRAAFREYTERFPGLIDDTERAPQASGG